MGDVWGIMRNIWGIKGVMGNVWVIMGFKGECMGGYGDCGDYRGWIEGTQARLHRLPKHPSLSVSFCPLS